MIETTTPEPMYRQVSQSLIRQIRSGKLQCGERALSERDLAQVWGISRGTARLALQELETLGFLERQGARGSFITGGPARSGGKIVFAFPEEAISPSILAPECWALASETHRGLIAAAAEYDVQVYFEHFQDGATGALFKEQLKRLAQYDAAVFSGTQLMELQRTFGATHPVYHFSGTGIAPEAPLMHVTYDWQKALQLLVDHACACEAQTVGTISSRYDAIPPEQQMMSRAERFLELARKNNLTTPECSRTLWSKNSATRREDIAVYLQNHRPDFIFCNDIDLIIPLYEVAADLNLRIGKDFSIAGIATGLTFQGLLPKLTYVRVPNMEMAQSVVRSFVAGADHVPVTSPVLVQGQSTSCKGKGRK